MQNIVTTPFSKETIPMRQLCNGDQHSIHVFRFKGCGQGPTTYLQASVHGSEVQGNAVLFELMKFLQKNPPMGDFIIVPMANPVGINQKSGDHTQGRFDPITGNNWNRMYWRPTCESEASRNTSEQVNVEQFASQHLGDSWEAIKSSFKKSLHHSIQTRIRKSPALGMEISAKMALTLQSLATNADIVLDLHTGPVSTRYIYTPDYAVHWAKEFHISSILVIPHAFDGAMDEVFFCPWWDLHKAFADKGVNLPLDFQAYTLEFGGQERMSLSEAKRDCQGLINYLKKQGALSPSAENIMPLEKIEHLACKIGDYEGLYAPIGGLVEFLVLPGSKVKKGEAICQILSFHQISEKDQNLHQGLLKITAPEDLVVINYCPSAIVHEGMELMRYMSKVYVL